MDIVTLFCIAAGKAVIAWCGDRCMQPWSSGLAPVLRFHSSVPISHSSASLIGLLASVGVKQQKRT